PGAMAEFTLPGMVGTYVVEYRSTPSGGVVEEARSMNANLDNTPSTITITDPTPASYPHSAIITLNYAARDDGGAGLASLNAQLDGVAVVGPTIDLLTLALGTHVFSVTAIDKVDNKSSASVIFEIIVTPTSIADDVRRFFS